MQTTYFLYVNRCLRVSGLIVYALTLFFKLLNNINSMLVLLQTSKSNILSPNVFLVRAGFSYHANVCRLIVCGPCKWRVYKTNLDITFHFSWFMENRIEATIQWGCQQFCGIVWIAIFLSNTEIDFKHGWNDCNIWTRLDATANNREINCFNIKNKWS